jgi:hypothetical protein
MNWAETGCWSPAAAAGFLKNVFKLEKFFIAETPGPLRLF